MSNTAKYQDALKEIHPLVNNADNEKIQDVVGNREDQSFSNYSHGFHPTIIGHLKSIYYHAHGRSFTIPDNEPIEIAPSATAWTYGTPVLIGTLANRVFDVHWVAITDIGTNGYYNVQLCNADGSDVYGKTFASRTANFTQEGNVPIQIPPLAAATPVYARVASSTGNASHTVKVKLFCHPYNDLTNE